MDDLNSDLSVDLGSNNCADEGLDLRDVAGTDQLQNSVPKYLKLTPGVGSLDDSMSFIETCYNYYLQNC